MTLNNFYTKEGLITNPSKNLVNISLIILQTIVHPITFDNNFATNLPSSKALITNPWNNF
jgi:hypothetical protein